MTSTGSGADTEVFVETRGRLHLGVLDLRGARGRWFGGVGAAAPGPSLLVSVGRADTLDVTGEDAPRAAEFARRFLAAHARGLGARIHVHRTIPSHVGLGSGTQLALAVARGLAEHAGLPVDVRALAHAVRRGRRSAVGIWTFADGGLVVEGGRRRQHEGCGPLLTRLPVPAGWRCVLAVPDDSCGLSGAREVAAFDALPLPPEGSVEVVSHLVLMGLLPAVADADLPAFGAALSEIQQHTGAWFATLQGGAFARGASEQLVRRLREWGAHGVGQSSWGSAVYGFVEGDEASAELARRLRVELGDGGRVHEGPFGATGARVWRAPWAEPASG